MKAPPFRYERPDQLAGALELLADPEAKALAGGQSLVPVMAMRLARPRALIDLALIAELRTLAEQDGALVTGAMVTQRRLEHFTGLAARLPLVAQALPHVGHREIRNRGTVGGSVAHADPAAELLLVASTLRAQIELQGPDGSRQMPADEFAQGPFQTALDPGELLTAIRWPLAGPGERFAFEEVARRHGDFALCGVAVHLRRTEGKVELARVGLMGVAPSPIVHDVGDRLVRDGAGADGAGGDGEGIATVAEDLADRVDPEGDMHASGGYRRRLVRVLVSRCLRRALGRDELVTEVSFAVNGTEVTLDVEPRLTLVDALRHRLGLTGSHVGCEHGVCGACTVLVDGAAVRSCLMFCVQAEGAEVTTVEALGEIEDLHPLQQAFRRHHGLQCGFCTPGFLMSAYDLLKDREGVAAAADESKLREELSGVLCRCTGYAGIVEAVREVAQSHPDGVPRPKALGHPITIRSRVPPAGEDRALEAASELQPAAPAATEQVDVPIPEGEPNETIEVTTEIDPSPSETWELLSDFMRMTRCMPGVELDTDHGDDTYSGRVSVHLGPMRLSFAGAARVLERDEEGRSMRAVAQGSDASGSGVRADVRVAANPGSSADGTALRAEAKLYLSGRAAQFGRRLAGDVSRGLFAEFGACVERTLQTGEVSEPRRLSGVAVGWRLLRARVVGLVRRLRPRRSQ